MRAVLSSLWVIVASACAGAGAREGELPELPELMGRALPPAAAAEDGFYLGDGAERLAGGRTDAAYAAASPAPTPAPAVDRQVIYSAALRLVVVSAADAHDAVRAIAERAGGHLQESDARSITVRVPARAFDAAVAEISELGEVVERALRASDVTEELLDLGIRLENARRARERLLEHLARSEEMEDTLAIERELARVTLENEQLEGRQRYLQSQDAMSTIRVELNTVAKDSGAASLGLPFAWIGELGDGLLAGNVKGMPRSPGLFSRGPRFEPPPGFVRYFSRGGLVEALSADGLRLKLQEHENYDEGALAFWQVLARRALVETRALALTDEEALGKHAALLVGMREVAGQRLGYLLVLTRTKDEVYAFEAWGPDEPFRRQLPELVESARSLRP
jgi:hypothetical protein